MHGNQTHLEQVLNAGNATWEITSYSDIGHGFTDWSSDSYSAVADARSWNAMVEVFDELLVESPEIDVKSGGIVFYPSLVLSFFLLWVNF